MHQRSSPFRASAHLSPAWPAAAPENPVGPDAKSRSTPSTPDKPVGPESTAQCEAPLEGLTRLLSSIAARSRHGQAAFDAASMVSAFRRRIVGLELNLCQLTAMEERCIKQFLPEDWASLQAVAAASGGQGIAYVELEAELLPEVLPGLQQLHALDCLSVWAPSQGGSMDFGILSGGQDVLRINVLGTPAKPLDITVSNGVRIEGREHANASIAASQVYRTDEAGKVNARPQPLPRRRATLAFAHSTMPCVGDAALHETLVHLLKAATPTATPTLLSPLADPRAVASALVLCGRFDDSGDFGFDLKNLTVPHAHCVQTLPAEGWLALQDSAERAGEDISWIDLHDAFIITGEFVRKLNQLSPLLSLTVSTPARGIFLGLGKLQGGAARLQEVRLRCGAGKTWALSVPCGVSVLPLGSAPDEAMKRSRVLYEDESGKVAREGLLFPRTPLVTAFSWFDLPSFADD